MRRLVSLAACLLMIGLFASAGGAATPPPPSLQTLLARYSPVVVLHPQERFQPVPVDGFLADADLYQQTGGGWQKVDEPLPSGLSGYRLDQRLCSPREGIAAIPCYAAAQDAHAAPPTIYGNASRRGDRIVLQYWLFYYDNPLLLPATPVGTFWQSHEGDWELVNVVLDADEHPIEAAFSQHCSGKKKAWTAVEKSPSGSTHPVAYVALGSHANYFAPGTGPEGAVPINPACFGAIAAILPPFLHVVDQVIDGSAGGAVVGPPGSGVDAATIHHIEGTTWSEFGGAWGESEYFFTPIRLGPFVGAIPAGLAPASPANQANWNVNTILAWPSA